MGIFKLPHVTEAERTTFTPEANELFVCSDDGKLYVGDGATVGGLDALDVAGVEALPPGGATGQVLSKASGDDFDVAWTTVDVQAITVSTTAPVSPSAGDLWLDIS